MKVHIEFPAQEVWEFEVGKKNWILDGYTVTDIEIRSSNGAIRIISKNADGFEKTQCFYNVPCLVVYE